MKLLTVAMLLIFGGIVTDSNAKTTDYAIFAGGCFWCMEPPFDALEGVISTTPGYTAGDEKDPTYEQVASGQTGHTEAMKIVFDPKIVTYEKLLEVFWRNIDPTQIDGQFVDRGRQYRTGIYFHSDEQRDLAIKSKKEIEASGRFQKKIATEIEQLKVFYPAETYHQDYYQKNPLRYKFYRFNSGRDQYLEKKWGKAK